MTLAEFRKKLVHPDPQVRAYFFGKLMRQAKPDEVFDFVTLSEIRALWPEINRYLGWSREFWNWLCASWGAAADSLDQQIALRRELAGALCGLLTNPSLTAIENVRRLLEAGADLAGGLIAAPYVDGGFSPLVLAFHLNRYPVEDEAAAAGWELGRVAELVAFRGRLVESLLKLSLPE